MATEVGTAYVRLIPTMQGFAGQARKGLDSAVVPAAAAAGKKSGSAFGGTFGSTLKGSVKSFAGIFAAVGVAGFIKDTVTDFEQMRNAIVSGTGASGDALKGLEADARNVGKVLPTSFADAGQAVADWNTALGLSGKPLQELATQTVQLAKVTGDDLGQVIESNSRVMGDWGVATNRVTATQDKLFQISLNTGIGVGKLSDQMVKFGSPLRQLGFDFDTSAALMGKFHKEGVNGELVMGSLRIALGKMARDGEPAQETLARITDEIENAGSVSEANALALELFGARAGPDMAAAIREGRFEVGELVASLDSSDGSIDDAEKRTRTLGDKWQIFQNQIAASVQPALSGLLETLGGFLPAIGGFVSAIGPLLPVLLPMAGLIAGITLAQRLWNAAMNANPLTRIVTLLSILVTAITVAWQHSETFRTIVVGVWNGIRKAVGAVAGFFTNKVWPAIKTVWNGISTAAKVMGALVAGAWNRIRNAAKVVIAFVAGRWRWFRGVVGNVVNGIKGFLSGMWDGLADGAKAAVNAVISILNGAINVLNTIIDGINVVPGVSIPHIPTISYLAKGGVVTGPTLAMVGEGAEDEAVLPLSRLDAMLSASSAAPAAAPTVVIDGRGLPRALSDWLRYAVRTQGGGSVQNLLGTARA